MIRHSHAENRWGELYEGWEKEIPSQYEHRGPSLAEGVRRRYAGFYLKHPLSTLLKPFKAFYSLL